ncbi:hypothetical protein N7466_002993 [Penicillium verhagenii]|uniref:uncharacterized protein n=1 Tax=Penicillium verhagenii TaxID=1562060 RepID=UPI002545853B|nr:uncharacterized protein N7466_002993 [Penicillium verhagenii]KAJ5936543.1 hypothetical protein N7466_002993 [Penicillium verhagenii]
MRQLIGEVGVMLLAREKNLDGALQTQATSALEQINRIVTKFKPLMTGRTVAAVLTKPLRVFSPRNAFAAHNFNVTQEAPVKEAIHHSDCLQSEKEDVVDWDFWLTPKVLSGEGPPPFG